MKRKDEISHYDVSVDVRGGLPSMQWLGDVIADAIERLDISVNDYDVTVYGPTELSYRRRHAPMSDDERVRAQRIGGEWWVIGSCEHWPLEQGACPACSDAAIAEATVRVPLAVAREMWPLVSVQEDVRHSEPPST